MFEFPRRHNCFLIFRGEPQDLMPQPPVPEIAERLLAARAKVEEWQIDNAGWDLEVRMGPDGQPYTQDEFYSFYNSYFIF